MQHKIRDMSMGFGMGMHVPGNSPKTAEERKTAKHKKTMRGKDYSYKKPGTTEHVTPKKKGQKSIKFKAGSLHKILGVPQGTKIPASKMAAAKSGKYGKAAKEKALLAQNVLKGR